MKKQTYPSRRKKFIWLCLLWVLVCCVFYTVIFYYAGNGRLDAPWRTSVDIDDSNLVRAIENMKANNETGAFSLSGWEDANDARPKYAFECQNVTGEKGQLGIFKTAAYKHAIIERLKIRLYYYSDQITEGSPAETGLFSGLLARAGVTNESGSVRERVTAWTDEMMHDIERRYGDTVQKHSLGIDLSNVTAVTVRDFEATLFHDGKPSFLLSCSKVLCAGRSGEIVFRGRVLIRASDGSELRSNHVVWKVEQSCFWVPGQYMLTRGGKVDAGQGFQCDEQLRIPVKTG